MKLALLVALATLATVSSYRSSVHSVVYKPGEQYVYHYKGQILNGIPKSTKQFSGLLIDSLVLLQFQQDYRVVMKLEKIKLYKVDDKVTLPPSESLPESEMTRLTGEQEQVIVEKLLLPIKFRYEEGEIRELQTETRDKYWSVNIKKGILSLFQVTLKEKHSLSSDSSIYYDPTMSRIKSYGSRSYGSATPYWNPSTKTNSVYTVKETDVSGNCETKYTIVNDNTARGPISSTMFITAVRNFDTCQTRPFNIEGLFQGVPTSDGERELVQPTVHTDYVITGDRTHFLIKEATRRGKYFVFVHGLEGGDLSSYVYQKLTLKSTESLRTAVHLMSPKTDNRGLQMIIPKANLLPEKETSYGRPSSRYESFVNKKKSGLEYELKKSYESEEDDLDESEEELSNEADVVPVIERKLRELTECIYMTTAERKCSKLLMEATLIIREATKDQLKTLYERHVKPVSSGPGDIEYRLSEMLLDILPTISTPGAAEVLIELTRERRITPLRASLLISTMSLTVKPNPTVIKQLLEMFKEMNKVTTANSLTGQALLRQSTLLAVGTIVHRLLVVMRSHGKPISQLITFVDTISTEMKRMVEESSGAEKILIVKAMGNMGASENIVVLRSIIENKSRHDLEVRISAIYAMRRVAKEFKKQVIPTLMGVFMDENEDRRARQASFMVIIKANPTYPTLQMIAHRASYDKCQQTKTLVYSNLINLAYYTSHQPEHKQLIKNTRMVLKAMMPVYVGFYDSMSLFTSHFSEKYDMGVAFDVTKIKSKNSGFPETILASLEATVFGKHRRILEAGAEGKAYTALLRKLFGPHGLLSQVLKGKVSIEDVLNTFGKGNLGGVEQKIIEVMNKMRMEVPSEEDLFANWYVKLFENELQYITLNSHNIEELINNVNRWIVDKIMQLSRGTSFDVIKTGTHRASLTVATCFGVPLHLNHTIYAIAKLEGSVKVNNLPTDLGYLWNQYKRFSLPGSVEQLRLNFPFNIPDIKFELNVKPVIDVSQYVTFTSDLRWLKAGVGVEKYLRVAKPFALTGELNKPQHSISIKYFPTKETIPMLHAKAEPILFFSRIPTTVTKLPYITEIKELQNEDIMKKSQFNQMVRIPLTGQELTLTGVYSLCGPRWCPIMPFFGKQEFVIISKPTSNNIDFLEMKITALKNNFEIEGIPSHLPTEELYEQYEQEYYEKESVNYRTASRRSAQLNEEFDPVPVDPAFESETPIKRQVRVTLRPSTWQVPSWKGQLTWYMSRTPFHRQNIKDWINQFNTQIIRNVHENTPKWKLVMNTVINPKAWIPTSRFSDFKEYLLKSEATLNLNGDVKNMRLKITPGSPFDFEEEMMRHMMWPIHDRPESKTPIHKYTAELMFPELNQKTKRGLIVINDAIKYFLHNKMVADLPDGPFENNKLIVSMELLPEWEKMHMIVKNAHESLYIADVPFYLNPFQLTNEMVKVHNHYSWDFYKRHDLSDLSTSSLDLLPYNQYPTPLQTRGECKLDFGKETIRTFDGARYSIKHAIKRMNSGCEVLVAQDCRKEGLFSVLTSGTDNDNWVEKVYLPDTEIITKYVGNRYIVIVNGQTIDLRPSRFVSIPSETTSVLYKIGLVSEKILLIEAKEIGLTIEYDQNNYTPLYRLSHGSMLWGNICGLCGNNNQDPSDDLELPSSLLKLSSSRPFYPAHIIPSGTCNIDTPVVDTDYCKKTTVLTVRRYENETPMTCTSEKRIVQCAEGCRPAQLRSVKTCFRCQSETGQSLARTSYYEQASVLDLEDSSLTCSEFSERVEVPTVCEPIY